MRKTRSKFSEPQQEPLFATISEADAEFQAAYDQAAATVPAFIEHVRRGGDALCSAKLRFRDPDESEHLGEDRFLFLWLGFVQYHDQKRVFSGEFFELPPELQK